MLGLRCGAAVCVGLAARKKIAMASAHGHLYCTLEKNFFMIASAPVCDRMKKSTAGHSIPTRRLFLPIAEMAIKDLVPWEPGA